MSKRFVLAVLVLGLVAASPARAQGPIAYGETLAGELSVVGEFDAFTFSAGAGDVVILRLAEVTAALEPRLRLLNPGGMEMHDTYDYSMAELDEITLTSAGVYTITVSDHANDEIGEYRLHLQRLDDPADATPLSFGATVAASLDDRAETRAFTLAADTDDRVLLRLGELASDLYPQLRIYGPDGARIANQTGNPTAEINAEVIPAAGVYTILAMDSSGLNTGGLLLHAQRLNDPAGATAIGYGETLPGTIEDLTATVAYRLTAIAGDRLLARLAEVTSLLEPRLRVYDPAGDMIANLYDYSMADLDAFELPATGTYTLLALDHAGDEAGDLSLHVQRTNGPADASALALGQVHAGALTARAQTVAFTVDAAANDRLLLCLGEMAADLYPQLRVYDPAGLQIANQSGNPTAEVNAMVVPTSGTYTVLAMDNSGINMGDLRIHCQRLNDPALATSISYGQTLTGNLSDLTMTRAFRLTAAAGDRILARLAELTADLEPRLRVYDPAGDMIANLYDYSMADLDAFELPATGTYTLLALDHAGDEIGEVSLHLQRTHDPAGGTAIAFGETLPGDVDLAGATVAYTFTAAAADRVLLRLGELASDLYPQLRVYDAAGVRVALQSGNPTAELNALILADGGAYTVLALDSSGIQTGGIRLHLQRLNDPAGAVPIAYGETLAGTIGDLTSTVAFVFTAEAGDRILARLAEQSSDLEPRLRVYDAAGDMIANLYDYSMADLDAFELPSGGAFTLLALDHAGDEVGDVSLHLQRTFAAAGVTGIGFGENLPGDITAAAATGAFTFDAEAGDRILLQMGELESDLYPHLRVYDPSGERIANQTGNPLCDIDPCEIATTGPHTVLAMDSSGLNTGGFRIHVQRLNDPGLAIPVDFSTAREDALEEIAHTIAYTFAASGGDSITATMTELTAALEPRLRLYAPDGTRLANQYDYSSLVLGYRLPAGGSYTILAMDHAGDETGSYLFSLTAIATAVPDLPAEITEFAFHGNHPNPFNPRTRFVFDLPEQSPVSLTVFGVDGRRLRRIVDEVLPQGRHVVIWDGRDDSGRDLPSGTYLGLLQAGPQRRTQRLALVR